MRVNVRAKPAPIFTHEGARARHIGHLAQLRRSVLSCLLWEKEFYEDGQSIADRIAIEAQACSAAEVAELAIEARHTHGLRHVPLLLLLNLVARRASCAASTIEMVISRPDELGELLSLYWANGKKPLSAQLKRGLAAAFGKFDGYQLAKYNRPTTIRLRDVLFLVHAKPEGEEQAEVWKALAEGTLASPDTWEVALSSGADKKATWERLLAEGKLGYLALLRNLRNMQQAGVDQMAIKAALLARRGAHWVLPFRYIAAARAVPAFEPWIDEAMLAGLAEASRLPGKTIILVDVSGSMEEKLSVKSDLTRMDAAAGLAAILPCEERRVFTFSERTVEVPPRLGMAGVDAVVRSQLHSGTDLGSAVAHANLLPHDRLIVITDEQSRTWVPEPTAPRAYMINVASAQHGVGYGKWTHIDGFSESVVRFIAESEIAEGEGA